MSVMKCSLEGLECLPLGESGVRPFARDRTRVCHQALKQSSEMVSWVVFFTKSTAATVSWAQFKISASLSRFPPAAA